MCVVFKFSDLPKSVEEYFRSAANAGLQQARSSFYEDVLDAKGVTLRLLTHELQHIIHQLDYPAGSYIHDRLYDLATKLYALVPGMEDHEVSDLYAMLYQVMRQQLNKVFDHHLKTAKKKVKA